MGNVCQYSLVAYCATLNNLISSEKVSGIYLILYIIKTSVITVGYDSLTLVFELCQIVDYKASEECLSVIEGRFINDNLCTFGLNTLHDTLDCRLAEIVGICLHGQAVNAHNDLLLLARFVLTILRIVACHLQHLVGYEVLTGLVALHNSGHHVLRYIGIVGKQLLGVLRQTITTIAKGWVVVMCAVTVR